MNAIPRETAFELCRQIRLEEISRWHSWFSSRCWECTLFSNGDPQKMGLSDEEGGYHGCAQVNARYALQLARVN